MSGNILLLTSLWPPNIGGAETYLWEIYRRYQPSDTLVVVAPTRLDEKSFDTKQPWQTIRIPAQMPFAYWNGRRGRWQLLKMLLDVVHEFDVRFVHAGSTLPDGLNAWMIREATGLPYLVYAYGKDYSEPLSNPWGAEMVHRVFRGAEQIVTCSDFATFNVRPLVQDPSRVRTAYPGVDLDRFQRPECLDIAAHRRSLHLPSSGCMLLTVARLVERKGHDMVIRALPFLLSAFPDLIYVIVGDGPDRARLQQLVASSGIEKQVFFTGQVEDSILPAYFHAADIFVMPNRSVAGDVEGFGITFIEAAAAGLPVVAGRSGGAVDAVEVGVTGFLVNPTDLCELEDCLNMLAGDQPLRLRFRATGPSWVAERFSWQQTAETAAIAAESLRSIGKLDLTRRARNLVKRPVLLLRTT